MPDTTYPAARILGIVLLLLCTSSLRADEDTDLPPPADRDVDFKKDIQPLLKKHCYECHNADTQEAGLRLDNRDDALAGGDSGDVINPDDSSASILVNYIAGTDPNVVMPPEGDKLTDEQIGLFRKWIDDGAEWPKEEGDDQKKTVKLWSVQPVTPATPPSLKSEWIRNDIDRFVLARLQKESLSPSPAAPREVLIRRLYLDLLGLLPEPSEVQEFVNDPSPDAYEQLVNRLLDSPHFGERWGRHWLDRARYADSDGYEKDRPRPNAWRWRDWVIRVINDDMPFDEFTIQQFAGDLIPNPTPETFLATAFHRQTLTNTEGGTDQEQFRIEAVFDRVETTGTVWLGLTVGCARCHSHKYDPITQREYYQLFAFLNNGDESNRKVPKSYEQWRTSSEALEAHDEKIADLERKLGQARIRLTKKIDTVVSEWRDRSFEGSEFNLLNVSGPEGTTFSSLEDGSHLVEGKSPDKTNYSIDASVRTEYLRGLRLHVLPDDKLPSKGPGRASNGNFVLSEFRVSRSAEPDRADSWNVVPISTATADFAQQKFPPQNALKKDSGWAVSPRMGQAHQATFLFAQPLQFRNDERLRVELIQQYGGTHTIGRFRIEPLFGIDTKLKEALASEPSKRSKQQLQLLVDFAAQQDTATRKIQVELSQLKQNRPVLEEMDVRVISQRSASSRRKTHVLRRGDFLQPLTEVQPRTPEVLPNLQQRTSDAMPDRLRLARWLVSDTNPLTPRVVVNHYWSHLFGEGLVRTLNDFGTRGDAPTHPELLDWLASEFRNDWSRKNIIRTIVNSATYRQSSEHRPELASIDATNLLLHRQNRFRVEAEIVRDIALQTSGLLSTRIGGPSVFPFMPSDIAALSYANNFKWKTSAGEDQYRRGMYTFFKRTSPHPNLVTFDCPDANTTCVDRKRSNTPLQALTILNNQIYIEAAQAFASRVNKLPGSDADKLRQAFEICVSRSPDQDEHSTLIELLKDTRDWYSEHPEEARLLTRESENDDSKVLASKAAWIATVRVLINLDEFMTRG